MTFNKSFETMSFPRTVTMHCLSKYVYILYIVCYILGYKGRGRSKNLNNIRGWALIMWFYFISSL